MTKGHPAARGLPLAAAALAVAFGLCLLGARPATTARAAQKEGDKDASPSSFADPACDYLKGSEPTVAKAGRISPAIDGCQLCHAGANMGKAAGFAKYKSTEFVRLNESTTWEQQDIHAAAMKCLTDEKGLGKQMEAALINSKRRPADYKVDKAPECLTCHSTDMSPRKPLGDKKYEDFATAPGGVTCTLCHGLHENWQNDHWKGPIQAGQPMPWRSKPPAEKFAAGMHDLRNPVVKAALCASCHVGSAAEGKVVTHEIYAAGHPPLPPFELASYMEGEPRHWGYPTELKFFEGVAPGDTWRLFHFHPAKDESYVARHFAAGAVASLRAEVELILADATRAANEGDVLDFARFDCYACHHELVSPSARQKRGYEGLPPGRTPVRAAAGLSAGLVARHAASIKSDKDSVKTVAAKSAGFDEQWLKVRKAATDRPLGHAKNLVPQAKAMKDWCDSFLKAQSDAADPIYTAEVAGALRKMLADAAVGPGTSADPEAALLLAWTARTLAADGKGEHPGDEKLKTVVPLNVRTAPFMDNGEPFKAKYAERMKKVATFEGPKFAEVFGTAFPKK